MEAITVFFGAFIRSLRLTDILDVALISICVYAGLFWLRRSATRPVVIVVGLIVAIYILARLLQLYLTARALEILVLILIVGSLIVFQHDIRRLFDRMALWRLPWQRFYPPVSSHTIGLLTDAVTTLAADRIGALIVLKGREPWDRQITGGIPLEGRVSTPLLCSIFNPTAPTHDGAVLIETDRVVKFGVHLPLSTNLNIIGPRGMRHTAALGMAEHCDALVLVVSEERGSVSIAEAGTLTELQSSTELYRRLEHFWHRTYRAGQPRSRRWWHLGDVRLILLSVAIAGVFWGVFAYEPETVYRTFRIPIEFRNIPKNLMLQTPAPASTQVTVFGAARAFRLLDPPSLAVSFDLSEVETGTQELTVTEEHLHQLPGNLRLYRADPWIVRLQVKRLQAAEVPVVVQTEGDLPPKLELVALTPDPARVKLMVPREHEAPPPHVLTEPIDLRKITDSSKVTTQFVVPNTVRIPEDQSRDVSVHVKVQFRSHVK
jgi:uncharacterized protein (TIGR00159 family)